MSLPKSDSKSFDSGKVKNHLSCLVSHVAAQLRASSFVTIIHAGSSDYLRFLHDLIISLLVNRRQVHIFDFRRRIKLVYLQQALRKTTSLEIAQKHLNFQVILNEDHSLKEYRRLHGQTPSSQTPPVLLLIDPSGLFSRIKRGVKQASSVLQMQYEAAQLLAEQGYAVVLCDAGDRSFHRVGLLVPAQLTKVSTLILQFLPGRILINY
ncbi:MAG: hypothetical protein ACFFDP_07590 [Promethearchaeota archaeon]